MFNTYLAFWTPGPFELIVILFVVMSLLIKWGLIIWGIVWLVRYLKCTREERQRLRMEIGKLADELEQVRKKIEPNDKTDSPSESG